LSCHQDPHQYLNKELESWELWNLDESRPTKPQLRQMAEKWIKDWNLRFKVGFTRCSLICTLFEDISKEFEVIFERFEIRQIS